MMGASDDTPLKVAIFDDVLAARREVFHIPGLEIGVYGHADDVQEVCYNQRPDVVCMDYAMGPDHVNGEEAIRALRAMGFTGRIVAMSSDPAANQRMIDAGANESLLQKAMLRSFLVALGAQRAKDRDGEKGGAILPVLLGLAALAALAAGVLVAGPAAWAPRWTGDLVMLDARVVPQGSPRSMIDGAPTPLEAVAVYGAKGDTMAIVAGDDRLGDGRFAVAARGKRWIVRAEPSTRWHVGDGPARRITAPGDVTAGAGLPGFKDVRYVARSRRVTEGQDLWIAGFVIEGDQVIAADIADERHRGVIGSDLVARPAMHGGGLALLALGAALLASTARVA
jgi:CheY-like chemotaxis protein